MRFHRHSLIGLFLAAVTLGLLTLAAAQILGAFRPAPDLNQASAAPDEVTTSARVMTVTAGDVTPVIEAYGEVRARRSLDLRSARAGRVVWTSPDLVDGGSVPSGALLVRLDQAEARAARDLAQADLGSRIADRAQVTDRLALARDVLAAAESQTALRVAATGRQRDLLARGAGSAAAVEAAELAQSAADQSQLSARQAVLTASADLAEAEAAIRRQQIALTEATRALAETEIRADFAGVLDGVAVVQGGLVGANEQVARLIDPAALDLWIRLSTAQFAAIATPDGQVPPVPVTATLQSGDTAIAATGALARVGAALEAGQSGRLVIATLEAGGGLRPGDFVAVTLQEAPLTDAAILPAKAIGPEGDVLALGTGDRLEPVPVTILRQQGDTVIIDARALDGREVVALRTPQTGAGIKVRPLRAAADLADGAADHVALDPAERARLTALVMADAALSEPDRAAMVKRLSARRVPSALVAEITARAGG